MKTKINSTVWGLLHLMWINATRWVHTIKVGLNGEDTDTRPLQYYEFAREEYEDED